MQASRDVAYTRVRAALFFYWPSRTIFGIQARLLEEAGCNVPRETDVTRTKVVCLYPCFALSMFSTADTEFTSSIPTVTVDCEYDDPLLRCSPATVNAELTSRETHRDRGVTGVVTAHLTGVHQGD